MSRMQLRTYTFTLLAEGADLQTDEVQDALFEAVEGAVPGARVTRVARGQG